MTVSFPSGWPKRCGCGREWSLTTWASLPFLCEWRVDDDELLELRTCTCGSTISVPHTMLAKPT